MRMPNRCMCGKHALWSCDEIRGASSVDFLTLGPLWSVRISCEDCGHSVYEEFTGIICDERLIQYWNAEFGELETVDG